MKNIYVYVDGSERSATAIRSAGQLANTFDAILTGFFVVPDVIAAAAGPEGILISESLIPEMQDHADEQAKIAEKLFRKQTSKLGSTCKWIRVDAGLSGTREATAITVLYADLIVIGQYANAAPEETDPGMAHDLVVDSGRPIIIVPKLNTKAPIGRRILIAWKECRESVRAVSNAIPFLSRADAVMVTRIAENDADRERASGDTKIMQLLADHGVDATLETVPAGEGESTSAALFARAKRFEADMLVAGAYSRSRLIKGLYGGVSKTLFEGAPIPALLSH
jgi:nucleotide-binding universal stress UspA family protein